MSECRTCLGAATHRPQEGLRSARGLVPRLIKEKDGGGGGGRPGQSRAPQQVLLASWMKLFFFQDT